MKTVATLPTAKAIPNTSRFLAFLTLLDCRSTCSIFESPLLDSFSVESNRNAIAIARLLRKPGGSKVAPYACDARWHGALPRWRSFFFFDRTCWQSWPVLRLQPEASYYSTTVVVLGLYLFDEVMPKSVEGEMAAKRADAIAAEEGANFVNTGTSRVRV